MIGRAVTVVAALALAACATPPPPAPAGDSYSGRLSLQVAAHDAHPARNLNASFELRGSAQRGELSLSTPLGTTLAQAHWRPGEAHLVTPNGGMGFDDLDDLTRRMLGLVVPLAALFDWLQARPWPDAPSRAWPGGFEQLGWQVDLSRRGEGWLQLSRPEPPPAVSLRLRLDERS